MVGWMELVGRIVGCWLFGWFDRWLVGCWCVEWLVGCLDAWMLGCLDACLDYWMVGWLDYWMVGWLDYWMVGWLCRFRRILEKIKNNRFLISRRKCLKL